MRCCSPPPSLQGPGTTYGENEPAGSENCLVLNVWTPAVNDGRRRPVMVYSHGGGYVSGSGGSRDKDGARLAATYHVVVVTTNHRLGLLGYLYPDAPPTAASVPLIVVLLRLAGGERPPPLAIVGVLIGFAGVALLFHPEGGASWWGIGLTGISALAWATGSYLSSRIPLPQDAFVATAFEMLAGGVLFLPFGLAQRPDPSEFSAISLVAFAYLILVGSLVGFTAYVWLLHHVPLGTVSTYAYVNPVVAIALGMLFLHERITWRIALGAAIVLASVAIVVRRETDAAVEPFSE